MLRRNHRNFVVFCEDKKNGFANSFYCCRHSIRIGYSPGCAQAKTVTRSRRSHVVGSAPMVEEAGLPARRCSVVLLQFSPHIGVVLFQPCFSSRSVFSSDELTLGLGHMSHVAAYPATDRENCSAVSHVSFHLVSRIVYPLWRLMACEHRRRPRQLDQYG